jgi:hypothetical protein
VFWRIQHFFSLTIAQEYRLVATVNKQPAHHKRNSESDSDANPKYQDASDSSSPDDSGGFDDEDDIGLGADLRAEFVLEVRI